MLARINNELGAISIDENIINEVIAETIRSFKGNVRAYKNAQNRQIKMTEEGVFIHVELVLKIGTSISEVAGSLIDALRRLVEEQLELEIDNIEVKISGMQSFGKTMPRDILYDSKNGLVRWNEQ